MYRECLFLGVSQLNSQVPVITNHFDDHTFNVERTRFLLVMNPSCQTIDGSSQLSRQADTLILVVCKHEESEARKGKWGANQMCC